MGRGLLRNCEEHIDNIITPLMHHRNTANEDDRNEGMCDWVESGEEGGRRIICFQVLLAVPCILCLLHAVYTGAVQLHNMHFQLI